MKTLKEFMTEAYGRKTTSLLPATKTLWDKNKVGVSDIADQWKNSKMTIQVAHVHDSPWAAKAGQKPKLRFVVGAGHSKYDDEFHAHHDQTGAKLGHHTVVNTIHIENGKVIHKDNDLHINDKAPVAVYK